MYNDSVLKFTIEELEETINNLQSIITNLHIEKEELKQQVEYWKDNSHALKQELNDIRGYYNL